MNEIRSVGINSTPYAISATNFKAANTVSKTAENPQDQFLKDYEKAKKQAKREKNLNTGIQIGILAAFMASVGMMGYVYFGKGTPKTIFKKISDKMPELTDECINPKARDFINQVTEILKTPQDLIKYTGAKMPRMVLFHGPTGTGKTFTAKLLAKEMGAEYGEIQFSDLSSEYIGKTAVNISRKFKELKEMAKKNPKKQFVVAFNEIDSLIGNVEKLGANSKHLAQNRTSFLNGLDYVKDVPNLTIVGTTNINPHSAQLDQATLNRLGNIFEIENPIKPEVKGSLKFHLSSSDAAKDLINDDAALDILAQNIVDKKGAQRDVANLVEEALRRFTLDIRTKSDAKSQKLTADYIQKAIDGKEVWAAGIKSEPKPTETTGKGQIPNKLVDEFYKFIAERMGVI